MFEHMCVRYKWIFSVPFSDTNWLKNRRKKKIVSGLPKKLDHKHYVYSKKTTKKTPTYQTLKPTSRKRSNDVHVSC